MATKIDGCTIVTEAVDVVPLDEAVTVYIPAARFVAVAVVWPLLQR